MGIYILLCYPLLLFNVFMILEEFCVIFLLCEQGLISRQNVDAVFDTYDWEYFAVNHFQALI